MGINYNSNNNLKGMPSSNPTKYILPDFNENTNFNKTSKPEMYLNYFIR